MRSVEELQTLPPSNLEDEQIKHEEETLEHGGQAPVKVLTSASDQDPDVEPRLQPRAVSESKHSNLQSP
jgi:hypothetical protein